MEKQKIVIGRCAKTTLLSLNKVVVFFVEVTVKRRKKHKRISYTRRFAIAVADRKRQSEENSNTSSSDEHVQDESAGSLDDEDSED
jgi:hypothetical protein